MLNKLKELIFGLNEFEKNKFEDRFFRANKIVSDLKINSIQSFEILEDIIYKIKEELRLKSSNLNKVIKNPKRNLKKNQILLFLERLNKIKYEFLEKAFSLIDKTDKLEEEKIEIENFEINKNDIYKKDKSKQKQINNNNNKQSTLNKEILISNKNYQIKLKNGKIPYLNINFENEINFRIIKLANNILFDNYKPEGINIIVEGLKCLIIPRFNSDNLLNLPNIQVDLNQIYEKIIQIKNKITQNKSDEIKEGEFKEINNEQKKENNQDQNNQNEKENYLNIEDEKSTQKPTLKKKEDSLDELINNIENKNKDFTPKPNPKNDQTIPKLIKEEEKIQIEKKEEKTIQEKNPQIIIEKKSNPTNENLKYEIYRDDKIYAYLNENSQVLGEIIIKSISNETISKMNENTFAYLNIFSKILSSILFEITKSAGTNILFNYKENTIKIVPRFENDNLNNLKWENKENTSEFLEQVKNKLIQTLAKEIKKNQNVDPNNNNNRENSNSNPNENTNNPNNNKPIQTNLEKKGEYILKSLSRIP